MSTRPSRLATWLLLLFLAAFAAWGARNPNLRFDSDPSAYLRFATALSEGRYFIDNPSDKLFEDYYPPNAVYRGTFTTLILGRGRGVVFYAIGFPLYLAAFVRLGGIYAAYFANIPVFLGIFVLLRLVTRRVFAGHPAAEAAGLFAPALYWLFNRDEHFYFLSPYRDPLSHLLLLASILAFLTHFQEGRRLRHLALSGLFLGLASTVRETSVLAALPLGVFWLSRSVAERRLPRPAGLAAFAGAALLGVAPLLVQNTINSGNPLYPTQVLQAQVRMGNLQQLGDDKQLGMRGLKFAHFRGTEPTLVRRFLKQGQPVYVLLLAIGFAAGIRYPGVAFLLLPLMVGYTVFFGFWIKPMMRYLFVTQIGVAPLLGFGAARAAGLLGHLFHRPALPTAAAGAALAGTAALLLTAREMQPLTIADAEAFRRDLEARVPAGALVVAERPMRDLIEHLTHASGLYADDFIRPERGLTFARGLAYYLEHRSGVLFLDNADADLRDSVFDTPLTRARLLGTHDLEPVAAFPAARYRMERLFGKEEVRLWRVVPWSRREHTARLRVPGGEGALLRLDGRDLAEPARARISVAGVPLDGTLRPGFNWFRIPAGAGEREVEFRVVADAPIPADLEPAVFGADDAVVLDAGPEAVPLDSAFLSPEFLQTDLVDLERAIGEAGRVRFPVAPVPESTLVFSARVRLASGDEAGRVRLGGALVPGERPLRGAHLRIVAQPVAPVAMEGARAEAEALIETLAEPGGSRRPLVLDRVTVLRLRHRRLPLRVDIGAEGDEAYVAGGLHDPERYQDRASVRIADGPSRVFLPVAAADAGRAARLTLRLFGLPRAVGGQRVRLALNDAPIGEFPLRQEEEQEITCGVPAGTLRAGVNELAIDGTTWRPADFGSKDPRTLGAPLDELILEPAP